MRIFVALDLQKESTDYIRDIQILLKKQNLFTGKFTEAENLHLTLKFLGEIDEDTIEKVMAKLSEIKFKEIEAELGEIGVFSENLIKIIWIKLNSEGIFALQKQIDEKLKGLFPKEERFMSHVTIARVRDIRDKKRFLEYIKHLKIKKIKFRVNKFFLKKSDLNPERPVYEDLEKYRLES